MAVSSYDWAAVFADMALSRYLQQNKCYNRYFKFKELQPLLRGKHLMLRKKLPASVKNSDGQWYAALGDYSGTAAPAWPINTTVHKALSTGDEFLEFDMDFQSDNSLEVHWFCIFNADLLPGMLL